MKELEILSDHTIMKLPMVTGKVLDVGSRGYGFSNAIAKKGYEVFAVEPDTDALEPTNDKIHLIGMALVSEKLAGKECQLIKWSTGEGNHLSIFPGGKPPDHIVQATQTCSISQINKMTGVDLWDIVKFDCEGAEYDVLLEWPGPIARQITVEFHEHCGGSVHGKKVYDEIIAHLSHWYEVVQHKAEVRYCCHLPNYWDSLFVLRSEMIDE